MAARSRAKPTEAEPEPTPDPAEPSPAAWDASADEDDNVTTAEGGEPTPAEPEPEGPTAAEMGLDEKFVQSWSAQATQVNEMDPSRATAEQIAAQAASDEELAQAAAAIQLEEARRAAASLPTIGRIVHYVLGSVDVRNATQAGLPVTHLAPGDVIPAIVIATEGSDCSLQLMLGHGTMYVSGVKQTDTYDGDPDLTQCGWWCWPPRA